MSGEIELRAFMGLAAVFGERGWSLPCRIPVEGSLSGGDLLAQLDIPADKVEVIFVNGRVFSPSAARVHAGDRVALVPPGTPGPYRVLMGFVGRDS